MLRKNIQIALQCCRTLALDKDPVAPFAPQAFYPFFWSFISPNGAIDEANHKAWFNRSLDVLKLCDAVYFYTKDGLPDLTSMSDGMKQIKELAVALGLAVGVGVGLGVDVAASTNCDWLGMPLVKTVASA